MKRNHRALTIPALLLAAAFAAVVTHQVGGRPTAPPEGCACVVSVNLAAVLAGLNERAGAELELKAMADQMIAEDEAKQALLNDLRQQLDELPSADEAARSRLTDQVAQTALEYQAWRLYATEQLDIEKSLMLRELDRSVKRAVRELADINGYDIVLLDDSSKELSVNPEAKIPREAQVQQQMTSRRSLYVAKVADITDELIERMNNAFTAGP